MASRGNPEPARARKGKFSRGVETAERDAEAVRLLNQGYSYPQIAAELGWAHRAGAYRAVQRAFADIARGPVEELSRSLLAQLEDLTISALEILEQEHHLVSHGKVIYDAEGRPLMDSGPKLAAIREVRQLNESIRKLTGGDAPARVSVDAENLGKEIGALINALTEDGADDGPTAG